MRTLKTGSRGSDVKQLQQLLGVKADGIFGSLTRAAVTEFQAACGLAADGIAGPLTWARLLPDTAAGTEDIKQFSKPHGSMIYGPDRSYSTYAEGGCGVAAFAIVARFWGLIPEGESATLTVQRLGEYAWRHGFRIKGGGTSAGLFSTNGVKSSATGSASAIEAALRAGRPVILHIKKGFPNGYTGKGHYIVAYGIREDRVLLRDVGSSKASRQSAPLASLTKGLKNAYITERVSE